MKKNVNHKENNSKTESVNKITLKDYFWKIMSLVLLVFLVIAIVFLFTGSNKVDDKDLNNIDLEDADLVGQDTKSFLEKAFSLDGIVLEESVYENGMYTFTYNIQGDEYLIYTSLDGEVVFIPGFDHPIKKTETLEAMENYEPEETEPVTLEKSEKPVVEAFVMSHCPYGIQFMKGILPVATLLQDTIDFEIKFVDYAMRPNTEVSEQLLQYCIQQDSKEKYYEYLNCFLEAGDSERCIEETNIDLESISTCMVETDNTYKITEMLEDQSTWLNGRYPQFLIHQEENEKYGVQGSPTFVINGAIVQSARSPQSLLETICSAFETVPRACNEVLSSATPQASFGFETTNNATEATCG